MEFYSTFKNMKIKVNIFFSTLALLLPFSPEIVYFLIIFYSLLLFNKLNYIKIKMLRHMDLFKLIVLHCFK